MTEAPEEEKPPHKLLIEFQLTQVDENLKDYEAIRGEPVKLILNVTNIGDDIFPGGTIDVLKIEYSSTHKSGIPYTSYSGELICPEIIPNNSFELVNILITPMSEGLAWITLSMKSNDTRKIDYYQNIESDPLGGNRWVNHFFVTKHEDVIIISLLKELLEKFK